ncbi:hypothetical protein Mp_5g02620 [Marchantia polymorpha subsp. ruderalis]|uniref:Uncharacterized protein n=1 Tax=Marchantia polymorpha subsp. ruderalis TaxID=1480154 RepID=A0AAF6BE89_MARPO|nr:hypothetical protein Mp_5g02620 [Marchantia polymorpha subsp. ruderalis]
MANSATIPAEGDSYYIVHVKTIRVLVYNLNRMLMDKVQITPFPSQLNAWVDHFTFSKSESDNGSWIIRGNVRILTTAGEEEGILYTGGRDQPGFEWDVIASSEYKDAYRIQNRHNQDLIYDAPVQDANPPLLVARYGKRDESDETAQWYLTKRGPRSD